MKRTYMISNFIYSAFSLLVLGVLYVEYFGADSFLKHLPPALSKTLDKIITTVFSEYNIIGLLIIYGICILFAVLTVILLIKNLIQKQKIASFVLSAISIISMIGFLIERYSLNNPALYSLTKWFCLFTTVMIIVQLIAAVINVVKSYSVED
ncbi:MAG: hypothetical protein K2G60_05420 [Oscillospiraceae bacterium]|nr:hypothetical protein [Oscillospiraceae bacterium]